MSAAFHTATLVTHILPADTGLAERFEDGHCARGSGHVGKETSSLAGVVDETAGRARGSKLAVDIGRPRMFRKL